MTDVHTEHCCSRHGCKYGDNDCTVVNRREPQSFPYEECDDETSEIDGIRKLHPLEHDVEGWGRYFEARKEERRLETIEFNEKLAKLDQLGVKTVEGITYGYFELEDGSVIRIRKRNDDMWSLDDVLHIEADEVAIMRAPRTRVIFTKRADDVHCRIGDEHGKWKAGKTLEESLGKLITSHMERFGIRSFSYDGF